MLGHGKKTKLLGFRISLLGCIFYNIAACCPRNYHYKNQIYRIIILYKICSQKVKDQHVLNGPFVAPIIELQCYGSYLYVPLDQYGSTLQVFSFAFMDDLILVFLIVTLNESHTYRRHDDKVSDFKLYNAHYVC